MSRSRRETPRQPPGFHDLTGLPCGTSHAAEVDVRTTLLALILVSIVGCTEHGRGGNRDSGTDGTSADPDKPPLGCDDVVTDQGSCPAIEDVCTPGVCGASLDCCWFDDGQWKIEIIDCPLTCPDAGVGP